MKLDDIKDITPHITTNKVVMFTIRPNIIITQ